MALYMGLDVGGTFVKGIIIDENGKLICEDSIPTVTGEGLEKHTAKRITSNRSPRTSFRNRGRWRRLSGTYRQRRGQGNFCG